MAEPDSPATHGQGPAIRGTWPYLYGAKITLMKLPHWLLVLAACVAAAAPVLASDLPSKWASLGPVALSLAMVCKSLLSPPQDPPAPPGGAS